MNVSKPLTVFYVVAALLLAIPGAWLLFAPEMALVTLHENLAVVKISNIHSQQTGLGLLLAAVVNLVCLLGGGQRLPLHVAVFSTWPAWWPAMAAWYSQSSGGCGCRCWSTCCHCCHWVN